MRKETQVSLAHLVLQVFQAPKERLVSLVHLVHQVAVAHLDHQELLCKAPRDSQELLDSREDQVECLGLVFANKHKNFF